MELQTSTGLRAEVRAASNAAMALTATRSSIRAGIAAVKQAITEARLAAARTGDPIEEAAPAEKAALAELLEERDTLVERHHVVHENAALLAIRAESALISEVSTQIAKPGPTCNRLSRWPKPRRPPTSSSLRGSSALRRRDDAATRRFWRQSGARSCRRSVNRNVERVVAEGVVGASSCSQHATTATPPVTSDRLRFFRRRLGVPRGGSASASSYPPTPG